ncbi:MAG: hypothetical protein AB8G14_17045 [Ilumatobacter sp.]
MSSERWCRSKNEYFMAEGWMRGGATQVPEGSEESRPVLEGRPALVDQCTEATWGFRAALESAGGHLYE